MSGLQRTVFPTNNNAIQLQLNAASNWSKLIRASCDRHESCISDLRLSLHLQRDLSPAYSTLIPSHLNLVRWDWAQPWRTGSCAVKCEATQFVAAAPNHSCTHTHNRFTALWILIGTTRVSRYQKKHSPTPTALSLGEIMMSDELRWGGDVVSDTNAPSHYESTV